jgi:carbon-monoxide dehydrogenase medium subunit
MKPPPFRYLRPASLQEAAAALAEYGEDAKILAGGQSLVPLLNFRLARPSVLIDLGSIEELRSLRVEDGAVVAGAMVRQRVAESASEVREHCPILPEGLRHVGHVQIRNRGTLGGSLAHADPAAELPAIVQVADAEIRVLGVGGTRVIPADAFFEGPFMTALAPDEIVQEIRFPSAKGSKVALLEFARRSGDFALAGVAAVSRPSDPGASDIRLAAFGVGGSVLRLREAEAAIARAQLTPERMLAAADAAAASAVDAVTDVHATADYRRDLLRTLTVRTLQQVA